MKQEELVARVDPARLAAAARSILSCPDDVQLVVDGIDDLTAGMEDDPYGGDPDEPWLGMKELGGCPVFTCPPGAPLSVAGDEGRGALLTLTSGLGRPGSADRDATLTISGRLVSHGVDVCHCCGELRSSVALTPTFVLLTRTSDPESSRYRVPLAAFAADEHHLNRGFLQRSTDHANACHQDELRHAIATVTDTRMGDIGGVRLSGLRPDQVQIEWVDLTGAHLYELRFRRAATTPEELGELLRREIHTGLC